MELRVLRYFLAVAREESICGAHFQRGHRRRDGEAGQGPDRLRAAEAFLELLRQEGGDRE